jgi:hypothetical protein
MLLENRVYGLWVGKQTAKGTKNAAPSKRLVQVAGELGFGVDTGSENYSDLSKFGNQTQWVNAVLGQGTPGIEATPTELAYLLWLFHGGETVTSITGPPAAQRHAFKPLSGPGFWCTFARRLGQSVIRRDSMNDCRISQVVMEASTATKAVRITPTILSIDPGEVTAADPAAAMPTDPAFLYTDGAGAYQINIAGLGLVAFRGQSQMALTLNEDLAPQYGDDVRPYDLSQGNVSATLAATVLLDSVADARFNELVYGAAAPAAGTKPLARVAPLGGYSFALAQKDAAGANTGRKFDFTSTSVEWAIPDYPGPNPDGGPTELALAGTIRANPTPAVDPYTIGVETNNPDVAFTV